MKKLKFYLPFFISIAWIFLITGCNGILPRPLPQRTWTMPALLASGTAGGRPQIACNQSGAAVAVWEQSDGARNNIWAGCYGPGTGWGAAGLVESGSGTANCPQVAVDGSGKAIAVWQQSNGSRYDIGANRFAPGAGWGTAALIETSSQDAGYPQVAIDLNGNSIAGWHEYGGVTDLGGPAYNIYANSYSSGLGWGSAVLIESSPDEALYPQIAFDAAGNAIAVWQYHENVRSVNISVYSNRYIRGSGWGIAERIGFVPKADANPQLDIDNADNAFVIWQSSFYTGSLCVNHYSPGIGWDQGVGIQTDRSRVATNPQITVSDPGKAIAVWQQSDDTRQNIWANRYSPSTGWGTAVLIETDPGDAEKPQAVIDNLGNAVVVWQQTNGARKSIWANHYTAGRGWDGAEVIGAGVWGDMTDPQIAIDGSGNAVAVWAQNSGTQFALWARRYRLASEAE